jgi:Protein of unknown function (DUF3617)
MRNAILLGVTLLWPLASRAADDYKPLDVKLGLWESSTTNQTNGVPPIPEELLSRLTPDQRAKMEEAMKARAAKGPQTRVTKSCLTKDELNKAMTFGAEGNAACKRTLITSTSSKQDIRFDCNDEKSGMKGSGTVHVEAINSETVKGSAQVNVGAGNNMTMQMSFNAKWVSADCGDLGKK